MELDALLARQDGVVSRAQLTAAGCSHGNVERMLRRRELAPILPRVFVDHTGPPTWRQRAWAAVLHAAPAALSHASAVRVAAGRRAGPERSDDVIDVAVAHHRRLTAPPGVRLHRMRDFADRVVALDPPRIRLEEALLDVAEAARTDLDAVGCLADAVGSRSTTAARLQERAAARPRLRRRSLIRAVLADVDSGSCSALEHAYLDRVVRPHGLPVGERQVSHRHHGDARYRDVLLAAHDLCVELDGRAFHDTTAQRAADLDRDLKAAVDDDLLTVRLGWGQCVEHPCRTAERLARLLARRGWRGRLWRCGACAEVA